MSTRSETRERWRRLVGQQQSSGLSVASFCRRAGVPAARFYKWRRKLGSEPAFTEVKLSPADRMSGGAGEIELRLGGRRTIVVRRGFDRQTLIELLAVLETSGEATEVDR